MMKSWSVAVTAYRVSSNGRRWRREFQYTIRARRPMTAIRRALGRAQDETGFRLRPGTIVQATAAGRL